MKTFYAAFLALMLLMAGFGCAESQDYSTLSDEALERMLNAARVELVKRGDKVFKEDTVLFEENGITVYVTGEYEFREDDLYPRIELEFGVINESDRSVNVYLGDYISGLYINGMTQAGGGIATAGPGGQSERMLPFALSQTGVMKFDQLQDMEMHFYITDSADEEDVLFTVDPVWMQFNVSNSTMEYPEAAQPSAESLRCAVLSVEELRALVSGTRLELMKRSELYRKSPILLDEGGVSVYMIKQPDESYSEEEQCLQLYLWFSAINQSGKTVSVFLNQANINGAEAEALGTIYEIGPDRQDASLFVITSPDAEIKSLSQIQEMELWFGIDYGDADNFDGADRIVGPVAYRPQEMMQAN